MFGNRDEPGLCGGAGHTDGAETDFCRSVVQIKMFKVKVEHDVKYFH